ncbi:hypothetical protein NDU88_006416 [Pleurodeles waltl]|uniref:Uncharacterized protein n=1 Tax=Pleurodeles waltl TaxID=8319 RepID=A0AAV7VPL8_PLEWA|nr:hypothetical protein NDU88_006416 [Pleurodeles waltl]
MAPASEWRCSRGRKISVTLCPDDRGAGDGAMTPDFRIRGAEKREDRDEWASEEPDVANFKTEETTEMESGDQEERKTRAETTDDSRDKEGTENPERSKETL